MAGYYNFKHIRTLLSEGFAADELLTLCFDEAALRPVYDNWIEGTKSDLIRTIVDHAHRHLALDTVLAWAKAHNPHRYKKHGPYQIWLTTKTGFRMEKEFHYVTHAADVWSFTWR